MEEYYFNNYRILCSKAENGNYTIHNTLSGDDFSIDEFGYEILKKMNDQPDFHLVVDELMHEHKSLAEKALWDFIEALVDKGIVYRKEKRKDKKCFHIQWHLSDKCNLRCKHCYQVDHRGKKRLDFSSLLSILNKYFDLTNKLDFHTEISLTGGEPFLDNHLYDLLNEIRKRDENARLFILTNGTLIDKHTINRLLPYNISGVQVSFDGYNQKIHDSIRGNGSFLKAQRGLRLLQEAGIWTSIHSVLMKNNADNAEKFFDLARELKVSWMTLSRIVPCGKGTDRIDNVVEPEKLKQIWLRLIEKRKNYPEITLNTARSLWGCLDHDLGTTCPAGDITLTILHDGTVLPCRRFPIKVGNILESTFFEIINRSKILRDIQRKIPPVCNNCDAAEECKGGCPGLSFAYHGTILEDCDPQCWRVNKQLPKVKNINLDYNDYYGYFTLPKKKSEIGNLL